MASGAVEMNNVIASIVESSSDAFDTLFGLEVTTTVGLGSTSTFTATPTSGVTGLSIIADYQGTGNTSLLAGEVIAISGFVQTVSVTDMYGLWIQSPFDTNNFTGTTNASVRIDDPNTGSFSNTYALLATGSVAVAGSSVAAGVALTVTGDAFSSDIVDFYQTGFPSTPALYLDTSGSLWLQNTTLTAHTIQLYDTTFEILTATSQAQVTLSVSPHFHLSDTTPSVMDLYTSYLGFGAAASDTFLSRTSAGVFAVGQAVGDATGTVATGGLATSIQTQVTTYLATEFDHTINCNGTFTLTLPTTGIQTGQEYYIKNIGTGVITVSSSVNIDFSTSLALNTQGQSVTVQWDGTQWWIY